MKKNALILTLIIIIFISCRDTAGDSEEHGRVVFYDSGATGLIQIYDDGSGYNNFSSVVVSDINPSLFNSYGRGAEYVAYTTGLDIRLYMFDGSFDGIIYPGGANNIEFMSVSPDQKFIAFSDVQVTTDFYILETANSLTPVSLGSSGNILGYTAISWSPDGNKVVYSSDSSGFQEIWKYNREGAVFTQLTNIGGVTARKNPIWSPGGDKILYLDDNDFGYDLLYTMNTDGSDQLQIASQSSAVTNPAWSPDGRKVAYIWNGQLFVVNADGSSPDQIAPSFIDGSVWAAVQVAWSTYGTKLAVTLNSGGDEDIYIVDPETDDFYMLADGAGNQRNPVWLAN